MSYDKIAEEILHLFGIDTITGLGVEYQDYYRILGLGRSASEREIKQAYRKLVRQYHPDVNDSSEAVARFHQVTEAYEVLSDSDKRRHYDQMASNYQDWQRTSSPARDFDWSRWTQSQAKPRKTETETQPSGGIFSDFFRTIFGEPPSRNESFKQPINGRDDEMEVTISLEEAYTGTTRQISRVSGRSFTARIPKGAKTGTKVRFEQQGEMGFAGGRSGDLYLVVNVDDHEIWERRDDDLYADLPIPLYTAILGGEVRVKTLSGNVKLKIPPETQSGKMIRLRERGMPNLREPDVLGDLFARVIIEIPTNLSDEEFELFEQLASYRPEF